MLKIEVLTKSHDREGFDCGSEPLNLFLKQTARPHARRGISGTFVLVEETRTNPQPILGFFSLNVCQVKFELLPLDEAEKLPRGVSGIRLGRLAVATTHQQRGLGKKLLVAAMETLLAIFARTGGMGLFVDAKDAEAKAYYKQFGFVSLPSNELQLFLPVRTMQEALR